MENKFLVLNSLFRTELMTPLSFGKLLEPECGQEIRNLSFLRS